MYSSMLIPIWPDSKCVEKLFFAEWLNRLNTMADVDIVAMFSFKRVSSFQDLAFPTMLVRQ